MVLYWRFMTWQNVENCENTLYGYDLLWCNTTQLPLAKKTDAKPIKHKDMSSHIEIIIAPALKMVFYSWAFQQAMASNLKTCGERTTKKDHLNPVYQNAETSIYTWRFENQVTPWKFEAILELSLLLPPLVNKDTYFFAHCQITGSVEERKNKRAWAWPLAIYRWSDVKSMWPLTWTLIWAG